MKIDNYNERLKGEYRTLVVAFLNAVEKILEKIEKKVQQCSLIWPRSFNLLIKSL